MSLGAKIKDGRSRAGLTQQQLAEKVHVSRQAVSKWESDRGVPDVVNLQALAALFDTTVDALLADDLGEGTTSLVEGIDARSFEVRRPARHRFDAVVRAHFPGAEIVQPLTRTKKLSGWKWWLDLITFPGAFDVAGQLDDRAGFFLVEEGDGRWLVKVSDTRLVRTALSEPFAGRRLVIGDDVLRKAPYRL